MIQESLVEKAYQIIEEKIVTLKLEPGMLISEKQISEEIGIGRMPVREAFKKLEAAHLVKIMPRRGMMVTEIKLEEVFQQLELRRAIEGIAAKSAAQNATESERKKFADFSKSFKEATDSNDSYNSVRIDNEFNLQVLESCRNPFLKEALRPLYALSRRLYYMNYSNDSEIIKEINKAHCGLMNHIAVGDEKGAVDKTNVILDCVTELYKKKYLEKLI